MASYKLNIKRRKYKESLLTQERLRELFHYDRKTGIFTRLVTRSSTAKVGDVAGSIRGMGYLGIYISGYIYLSHRLAWLYIYGEFPTDKIDHKDHVRHHNWISNLREVTNVENQRNMTLNKDNKSGCTGIWWDKNRSKWECSIKVDNKSIHIGRFKDKKDAIEARKSAEKKYNFHKNHGKKE